jgi:hypothetical protein
VPLHPQEGGQGALAPPRGPLWLIFRGLGVCAVMSSCAVVPGCTWPRPGNRDGGYRCRRSPISLSPLIAGRPDLPSTPGQKVNFRHITRRPAGLESLCVTRPPIGGMVTHDNEKDQHHAALANIPGVGEQETRGRGRRGRAGTAGPRNKPTGSKKGARVPPCPLTKGAHDPISRPAGSRQDGRVPSQGPRSAGRGYLPGVGRNTPALRRGRRAPCYPCCGIKIMFSIIFCLT